MVVITHDIIMLQAEYTTNIQVRYVIYDKEADKSLDVQVAIDNWKKRFYELFGPTFHKMSNFKAKIE
jgi:uncharacterized membrane protein